MAGWWCHLIWHTHLVWPPSPMVSKGCSYGEKGGRCRDDSIGFHPRLTWIWCEGETLVRKEKKIRQRNMCRGQAPTCNFKKKSHFLLCPLPEVNYRSTLSAKLTSGASYIYGGSSHLNWKKSLLYPWIILQPPYLQCYI